MNKLAAIVFATACLIAAVAYAQSQIIVTEAKATADTFYTSPNGTWLTGSGLYMDTGKNFIRTYEDDDQINFGAGVDMLHFSDDSDLISFGGGQIGMICFDAYGATAQNPEAFQSSQHYIECTNASLPGAELKMKSENIRISSAGTGDVIVVLGE